jgi:acetolactate synthase-1/3 small subunit
MLKVEIEGRDAREVVECVRRHRGLILDETGATRMVQLSGTGSEIDVFLADIGPRAKVLELVRSGVAAMARGHDVLALPG